MIFYTFDDLSIEKEAAIKNSDSTHKGKWCDAWEVDRLNGESEKCPLCGRHVSMLRWLEPCKIRLSNTKYPDRITAWLTEPMVVSERVKDAYQQNGLTGILKFIPVEIVKVAYMKENSPKPPKYFYADIPYTTNIKVYPDETVIVGQKNGWTCTLCNPWGTTIDEVKYLSLNTTEWKGEDVFKIYSLGATFVSKNFFDLVNEYYFSNFNLVRAEEYTNNHK